MKVIWGWKLEIIRFEGGNLNLKNSVIIDNFYCSTEREENFPGQ